MSYKCFQLCFNKKNPSTNFIMDMKINQLNYYDFNINLNLTYNLYLKELNKTLVTMYTITLNYDIDKKSHFFDIKVNYELENKEENKFIKIELKEAEEKKGIPKINVEELLNDIENLKNKIKYYEEDNNVKYEIKKEDVSEVKKDVSDVKNEVKEVSEVNNDIKKDIKKEDVENYEKFHANYLCSNVDVAERPNKKKINIENKLIDLLNDNTIVPSQLEVINNDIEDIEEKLYCHLKLISTTGKDIKNNITFIITQLIKFIENFNIPGVKKKELIISTIHKFLIEQKVDQESIDYIIDNLCPEMIEMLISVDKRKVSIKKKSMLPCK
jgi:hypothetical protein